MLIDKNAETKTVDSPPMGGLDLSQGTQDKGPSVSAQNASASQEVIRTRKQRSDAGQPRKTGTRQSSPSVQTLSEEQFKALYSPELWARIAATPADTALAITGHKVWQLADNERSAMGASTSLAAQCFAVENPKWLALAAAVITLGNVYGTRLAIYFAEKKKEQEEAKKNAARIS